MMTKGLCFLILLIGVSGIGKAEVCVRPIYPFASGEAYQQVLDGLQKKGVTATVCGKENQAREVWFYPMNVSGFGETFFYLSTFRTYNGLMGTFSTFTPHYTGSVWVLSLHPYGRMWSEKRIQGYSLKSQSKKMGKWLAKR